MLLGFVKQVVKIKRLRLSANTEQRRKGSLGWKEAIQPSQNYIPTSHIAEQVWTSTPAYYCICCFSKNQSQVGSSSLSSLSSQIHLSLKDYIFLCSLIRCPFDLGLQRQTKKIFIDSLFLHHDCPWHVHICVYLYIQGCRYLKNDLKPL